MSPRDKFFPKSKKLPKLSASDEAKAAMAAMDHDADDLEPESNKKHKIPKRRKAASKGRTCPECGQPC